MYRKVSIVLVLMLLFVTLAGIPSASAATDPVQGAEPQRLKEIT